MKTLIGIVVGVVAIELLLAVYKVPIAELPLIMAVSFVALAFLVLAKVHFATLADRRHERETYTHATQFQFNPQSLRDTIPPQTVTRREPARLSAVQKDFILAAIQNGAELVEYGTDYYAETANGEMRPLSTQEADYWQMCERMLGGNHKLLGGGY